MTLAVWLPLVPGFLLLGAILTSLFPKRAQPIAVGAVSLSFVDAILCTVASRLRAGSNPSWGPLRLDALGAPELLLTLGLSLAVLVSAPRRRVDTLEPTTTVWLALTIGMCALSATAWWLGVWQLLALVPVCWRLRSHRNIRVTSFSFFGFGSAVPLALVLIVHDMRPWATAHGYSLLAAEPLRTAELWVLWVSLLARMGMFPIHSWLLRLSARGPLDVALLTTQSGMSLLLFVRLMPVALHLNTLWGSLPLYAVMVAGLLGAWFASLMAVGQQDLRRGVASVSMSVHNLLLVALASANMPSVSGAMMYSTAIGLGVGGLMLVGVWTVARVGQSALAKLGGLGQRTPHLAMAYLTFSAVTFGLPGTLTFVAEDLMMHGLLEHRPVLAAFMMGCTVLNAIALMRLFARAYLGAGTQCHGEGIDLLPRERWVAVSLIAAALVLGVYPDPLLRARDIVASDVLRLEHQSASKEAP
jgi:NADH-quinone oxidoreductase subunit M